MKSTLHPASLSVRVILLRPEQGRNVGTVVRAAANFGAESVRLVGAAAWNEEEERQARIASAGAWDLMGGVRLHHTLDEAAGDCTVLAGTSARTRRGAGEAVSPDAFFASRAGQPGVVGLLFGPESQGLSAEELSRCHVWIRIPTEEAFPSLNLAQAALLLLYEAFRHRTEKAVPEPAQADTEQPATVRAQEAFLARWEATLSSTSTAPDPRLSRELAQLRRLLHRASATPGDLALLENLLNRVKMKR